MTLPVIDPKQPFQPEYQNAIADLVRFWRAGQGRHYTAFTSTAVWRVNGHAESLQPRCRGSNLWLFEENRATLNNTIRWRFQKLPVDHRCLL